MIQILDSTLREGEQSPGVYFSLAQKVSVACLLDEVGVDIIEVGNPVVDTEIEAALRHIARLNLNAQVGAHARCKIDDVRLALDCGCNFLGVFLDVSQRRLKGDLALNLEQALSQIDKVVSFARSQSSSLNLRFTLEDAPHSTMERLSAAAIVAAGAGANIISIADTTGSLSPFRAADSLSHLVRNLKGSLASHQLYPLIEVHCHNDRGLALANALDAYQAGADIIDASVLGLGERAGIVDLAELAVNLSDSSNNQSSWDLSKIYRLYLTVSRYIQKAIPDNSPVVGKDAFTHYSGVHVKAFSRNSKFYQSLPPQRFGREHEIALGVQSGWTSIKLALEQIGRSDLTSNQLLIAKILQEVKQVAKSGVAIEIERNFREIVDCCERSMSVSDINQSVSVSDINIATA